MYWNRAILADRLSTLGYLVTFGQVWVEVVLSSKEIMLVDMAEGAQAYFNSILDNLLIKYWQGAWVASTNLAQVNIWLGGNVIWAAAEDLASSIELYVNFYADNYFV